MIETLLFLFMSGDESLVTIPWGERVIPAIIEDLPLWHTSALKKTTVKYEGKVRGVAYSDSIAVSIRQIDTQIEFAAIVVHEIGHVVDIGTLTGNARGGQSRFRDGGSIVYQNDPSVKFYAYSWLNENKRTTTSKREDFVSGYAMENPFEDFAETYTVYRTKGAYFRCLGVESPVLRKKYWYMHQLFGKKQFQTEADGFEIIVDCPQIYDVSLIK